MKKSKLITAGIIVAALVLIVVAVAGVNNRAISLEEQISGAEAQISVAEKRRVDLIYNLVDTVTARSMRARRCLPSRKPGRRPRRATPMRR